MSELWYFLKASLEVEISMTLEILHRRYGLDRRHCTMEVVLKAFSDRIDDDEDGNSHATICNDFIKFVESLGSLNALELPLIWPTVLEELDRVCADTRVLVKTTRYSHSWSDRQ